MAAETRAQIRIALATSALLHIALLAGLPSIAPRDEPPSLVIEARLAAPPVEPTAAERPKPPAPKQPARPVNAAPRQSVSVPVLTNPVGTVTAPQPQETPPEPDAAPAPTDPPVIAQAPAPGPPEEQAAPPSPEPVPQPVASRLPRQVAIAYDLYMGTDRFSIGRTLMRWESQENRYRISSQSETTGVAGLFRPYQLSYSSEGTLIAGGLRPERFAVRRGRSGERQAEATFNWTAMTVDVGPTGATRQLPLAAGTLDLMSFLFQLALAELAPGRLQLSITNASRVEVYVLDVGATEAVETPLGTLTAWPVRQQRAPGQEGMEIWLAPQLRQLPVRIRFIDREGKTSGEQIAREIQVDGD